MLHFFPFLVPLLDPDHALCNLFGIEVYSKTNKTEQ